MIPGRIGQGRTVSGLRTRYFPKSRIGHGLVTIAPWIDVVLMVGLFIILDCKFVIQPGEVIELPASPFTNGSRLGRVAIVMSVSGRGGGRGEIIFFEDVRFRVKDDEQMLRLKKAFAAGGKEQLTILADSNVHHGTVVRMLNMAQEVGVKQVNVASRPHE